MGQLVPMNDLPDSLVPESDLPDEFKQRKTSAPSAGENIVSEVGQAGLGKLSPVNPYGSTLGEAGQAIKSGIQTGMQKLGQTTVGGLASTAADIYAATHGLPPVASMGRKIVQSAIGPGSTTIAEAAQAGGSALKNIGSGALAAGRGLVQGAMAPENLMTLPYNMAAYEQEKIRQNPNAPGLQSNPYAQTVRGEASTQGRAGAANQMRAVANMPYGNVTPEERKMLEEDARMKTAIRKKAFEKVMGPVVPGSF